MHFGFALELSNVDSLNIDLLDTHLDLLDIDIPSMYFACLHIVFKMSSRHILNTSSRPTNVCWVVTPEIKQVIQGMSLRGNIIWGTVRRGNVRQVKVLGTVRIPN